MNDLDTEYYKDEDYYANLTPKEIEQLNIESVAYDQARNVQQHFKTSITEKYGINLNNHTLLVGEVMGIDITTYPNNVLKYFSDEELKKCLVFKEYKSNDVLVFDLKNQTPICEINSNGLKFALDENCKIKPIDEFQKISEKIEENDTKNISNEIKSL